MSNVRSIHSSSPHAGAHAGDSHPCDTGEFQGLLERTRRQAHAVGMIEGRAAGERDGYVRGTRWGMVTGVLWGVLLGAAIFGLFAAWFGLSLAAS